MKSFTKLREACWKGYKAVGNKKKGDRLVPNCVPEEVQLQEEDGYPHEVHVRNYDEPDDEHSTFPKDHINYGVNMHHGTYKGVTDKGYVFGFREKEHANKFVQHVNTHKHTHAEHLSEEITREIEVNEITQKYADNYLSTVTKQQLSKHGMQPDMYGKLSKNRQQGVSNAFKRLQVDKEGKPVYHLVTKEEHIDEAVDKKDTVTVDIPLLIRLLEHAREDIKSDADLHRVVEKLISIRNNGVLTMNDYDTIVAIKEEVEQIDEIGDTEQGKERLKNYRQKANLQKYYTMKNPSADDALNDRKWKNRNFGIARATKRLGEDGISAPGPTNTTGSGAVAGMGQPPGSKSGEPGVHPMRKKKVVLLPMGRRTPPKM